MATWHQAKNPPARYWHDTKWVVLVDPPGRMAYSTVFADDTDRSYEAARTYAKGIPHAVVLTPASVVLRRLRASGDETAAANFERFLRKGTR